MRIRQKLVILLLLIGLIPTLAVSTIAYLTISRELTAKTTNQLESTAIKQARKVEPLLQKKKEEVIKLANTYELQVQLASFLATNRQSDHAVITDIIRDKKIDNDDIQAIHLTSFEGKIIASTVTGALGQGFNAKSPFIQSQTSQDSALFIREDPRDKINKLFITTTVSVNRSPAANLTIVFRIDDIVSAVQDYTGLGNTGETVITALDENRNQISLFPLRFDTEGALVKKLNSLKLAADKKTTYTDVKDYRNKDVIVAVRSISVSNWLLATKIDAEEAYKPISALRSTLIAIVLGSSLIIIGLALWLARILAAPIVTLTNKTHKIMQGDFSQRIEVRSSDEIGRLSTAFNTMTEQLAESYQALEQKVRARTKELNQKVRELGAAKAKDDAILTSIGEGMIVTDSSGIITLINETASKMLGIAQEQATGSNIKDYKLLDEAGKPISHKKSPLSVALADKKKVSQPVQAIGEDGVKSALMITATPVIEDEDVIGTIQIIRDITKEKEVDRMKTEFISIASHQLRTPLSAIRWFSEMLLSGDAGKLNTEQLEFTQNVADSTKRMIDLVNSLLNISRLESGRIIVDPKPTDLNELVSGIVKDLKGKIEDRRQTLTITINKDLPIINLDQRLIGQVYLNLLTNAIKYTPQDGKISLLISRKGDQIVSEVTDSGYGIPKEEQSKMFQKFFRATNIAKVETDGTGLGMYLVKGIVESSGGKIWFKSELNKGTTFWFTLPVSGMQAKAGEVSLEVSAN